MEDTEAVAVEISFCEKNKKERRNKRKQKKKKAFLSFAKGIHMVQKKTRKMRGGRMTRCA